MTYAGTWRETMVCRHDKLLVVPATLPIHLAATLMVNPATAYRMMNDFVELKEGSVFVCCHTHSLCVVILTVCVYVC